jgi:cytochrome c oxidase subunit 2
MNARSTLAGLLLGMASFAVLGEGNPEAGKGHYATCVACHGDEGQGNAGLKAPRLTHLQPEYVVAQLKNFRAGIRGGESATPEARSMSPMANTLPDEQALEDVAAYIKTLPGEEPSSAVSGDPAMGYDYFNQFCGACHGAKAQGSALMTAIAPTLAGADDWYLVAQLKAFRAGQRGAHPDDKGGRQMRPMSMLLPDDNAIEDVVTYILNIEQ